MFRNKKYNTQGATIDGIRAETAMSLDRIPPQTPERKTYKKTENRIDTAVSKSVVFIKPSLNIRFRIAMFLRIRIALCIQNKKMVLGSFNIYDQNETQLLLYRHV